MVRTLALAVTLGAVAACTSPHRQLACDARPSARLAPPAGLDGFEVTRVDPSRSEVAEGHVLAGVTDGGRSWAAVFDGCGQPVWWRAVQHAGSRVIRAHWGADGDSILVAERSRSAHTEGGWIHRYALDDETPLTATRATEFHHDFAELGDGDLVWISWQYADNIWLPTLDADIVSDVLRTAPEGTAEATDDRLFSLLDDSGVTPWQVCSHMTPDTHVEGHAEWSHSNSVVSSPDGSLTFLVRYWDTVMRLDRDGTVAWQLGGPRNGFELADGTTLPRHAHMSEAWAGGMLVFDNDNHGGGPSRVVAYAIDEARRTVRETWSWAHPDEIFSGFLGDARRLPGGNVLVAWSPQGRLTEVTREGDIVWEAETDMHLGRIEWTRGGP